MVCTLVLTQHRARDSLVLLDYLKSQRLQSRQSQNHLHGWARSPKQILYNVLQITYIGA